MTTKQPRLSYKFQRLREALRSAIVNGELNGKLPGERLLAKRFHANAKTISKALSDLTSEGLLLRQVGRGTFVAEHVEAHPVLGKERKFRWITHAGYNHEFRRRVYQNAAQVARQLGHGLKMQILEVDSAGELPEGAISPSALHDVDGIVVFASRPADGLLADFLRRHIPLVLCNCVSPHVRTSAVHADYARGAYELAEHLIGLGHNNIRLALPLPAPSIYDDAIRGYETALRRYHLVAGEPLRLHHDMVSRVLDVPARPTGLIVGSAELACSIIDAARERSIEIPRQLSLTLMGEPGEYLVDRLGMTSYDVDWQRMNRWVMKLLIDYAPGGKMQEIFVPGRLEDRGSAGPTAETSESRVPPREAIL